MKKIRIFYYFLIVVSFVDLMCVSAFFWNFGAQLPPITKYYRLIPQSWLNLQNLCFLVGVVYFLLAFIVPIILLSDLKGKEK